MSFERFTINIFITGLRRFFSFECAYALFPYFCDKQLMGGESVNELKLEVK